jgi:hypothetical protein
VQIQDGSAEENRQQRRDNKQDYSNAGDQETSSANPGMITSNWFPKGESMSPLRFISALLLCLPLAMQAQTQVCGWMIEKLESENTYAWDIWLQSDAPLDFYYKIGGVGVVSEAVKAHSPGSGTFTLSAGKATKVWGFGSTIYPPAKLDFTIELHVTPADIFSNKPTPLLAEFAFRRDIPESEKKPPPTLAKKQCATVKKEK